MAPDDQRFFQADPAATALLRRYAGALSASPIRLTGTRDAGEIYDVHVMDCLRSLPFLPCGPSRVIDVGSGGGLPGLVWAICRSDISVTLLDSVRKKCTATEAIIAALGVKNVSVVWARCEEYAARPGVRESYALAAARAVAHTGVLAEYLSHLVAVGGRLLAFKGPKAEAEIEEIEKIAGTGKHWGALGLKAPEVIPYGDGGHRFVLWEKIAHLSRPRKYPRAVIGVGQPKARTQL
ncbi:MAG: 16S rRNA (guanine(527)-N(7))-methyltransferase RsmG [Synergistaceae bacterium]|jgi:16S rRNA (guanine527-N7)-methyltransferase|nr:16S rRNA (guanine(527)-N(7))-methyltransferase RsmG [Synergistaceae bacterium]